MKDDLLNAHGDVAIDSETEKDDGQTPVNTNRDDVTDPDKQEVAVGEVTRWSMMNR